MVQIASLKDITAKDIPNLVNEISPILTKRDELYNTYYRRDADSSTLMSIDDDTIKVALETYIADMTVGYFGGKEPKYVVNEQLDEEKQTLLTKIFSKIFNNKLYKKEMDILLRYMTDYNDDSAEHLELVKDFVIKNGCYEIFYENSDNEIVYSKLDALNTVAVFDYETPVNLLGLVRTWSEKDINGILKTIVEITDINGTRYYKGDSQYEELTDRFKANNWKDVPAFAIEQPDGLSIFESVISLIKAYERVIQNNRNMFQYNDNAILGLTGYRPVNDLTIIDTDTDSPTYGESIINPARELEDSLVAQSKVMYFGEGGQAEWIIKSVQDTATDNHKKTLIDLISMISGVPNISDLGFTNADNASAIDRKFFNLEQKLSLADKLFKKAYLRRWELVFDRINFKKNTKYDFRDIQVKLYRNLPTDKYTETSRALSLKGTLSDESVIAMLPDELDPIGEMQKMDAQTEEAIKKNIELMGDQNSVKEPKEEVDTKKEVI